MKNKARLVDEGTRVEEVYERFTEKVTSGKR